MARSAAGLGIMLDLLKGTRVISFNHFLLGPMGIQALGDLGADVVSVETPEGAWQRHWSSGDIWHDGQSALHLCANRNKRSVAIDLKTPEGRELALRLVDTADVVAENFRPGVMEKLGLGYEALKARRPSLIYASASGYGPDGPYAAKPGQDLLAQALFGLMAITGQAATGPRPAGVSVVDHHGAAVFAVGILAAIVRPAAHRTRLPRRRQPDAGGARSAVGIPGRLGQRAGAAASNPRLPSRCGLVLCGALRGLCDQGRPSGRVAVAA
jgi:crotonobetainyl-CoA:carnitine CoA-transferase CaiB-like acyl-CoA transferase